METYHNDRRNQMDTKQIVEMHVRALDGQKEELRKSFLAELQRLSDEAQAATHHQVGERPPSQRSLPPLAWLETSMARLRETREAFEKAEAAREVLRRVSEAADFEASRKAG
jgi:hypothetical protein